MITGCLSQTAEYALRAMIVLAERPDRLWATEELAEVAKVPPGYLAKVLQDLGRAKLVRSKRGRGGGFCLREAPEQTNLLRIVQAVQAVERIETCPLDLPQHRDRLCPLHARMDEFAELMLQALDETTLRHLLDQATPEEALTAGLPG